MANRTITEADFNTWLPATEALELVTRFTHNSNIAAIEIIDRITVGLIAIHARHGYIEQNGKRQQLTPFSAIDPRVIHQWEGSNHKPILSLWKTNSDERVLRGSSSHYDPALTFKYFDIRLEPIAVRDIIPKKPRVPESPTVAPASPDLSLRETLGKAIDAAIPTPLAAKSIGGAPKKEFWDDLWLAMFERLWLTDWKPKNQAEIENAMLDWASEHDHKLGSTSVKIPAKKLLALSRKE